MSRSAISFGNLRLHVALQDPGIEVHAKALERLLDLRQHRRDGIAGQTRELGDVLAAIAVRGRLLPTPHRLDGGVETLHLRPCVVVVVLALDVVTREREHPRNGVAVGGVAGGRDGQRAGRVGRDHLDLNPLGVVGSSCTERVGGRKNPAQGLREPRVGHVQVEESRPRGLGGFDQLASDGLGRQLGGYVTRRAPLRRRKPQRDVGRVVAVLGIARTLEDDRHAGDVGERARKLGDGILDGHGAIVWRMQAGEPGSRCALAWPKPDPGLSCSASPVGRDSGRRGADRHDHALPVKRELNLFPRLVDSPLDGRERDLERLRDLRVREADDIAQQQRHLEIGVQPLDRSPDGVDCLGALSRRVDDLERGNVLELDDSPRTALDGAKLVEHPVLRHLEEPGRKARAQRKSREAPGKHARRPPA